MIFRPLNDRIVVRREDSQTVSEGGILIPVNAQNKTNRGTVLSVGPGARGKTGERDPVDVFVGDTVIFGKYSGSEIVLGEDEVIILREDEIYVVVDAEE